VLAKPRQIKPWPELVGMLPLLKSQDPINKSAKSAVHLDMAQVRRVDAIGLAIFIARMVQTLDECGSRLTFTPPIIEEVGKKLDSMGFKRHLESLGIAPDEHRDLFTNWENVEIPDAVAAQPLLSEYDEIICVPAEANVSRSDQLKRIKTQIKSFLKKDEGRTFAHEQVMIILLELAKNTLDHSGKPAVIGLRFAPTGEARKFSFVYCDTGDGICHSVRRHMEEMSTFSSSEKSAELVVNYGRLAKKGSFSDFIHWALKPGNSTKRGNGVNLGLGLMLIVQASKHCGFRLSVKDADTMLTLTELANSREGELSSPHTHALIRQLGVNTCAAPILMFHGEIE